MSANEEWDNYSNRGVVSFPLYSALCKTVLFFKMLESKAPTEAYLIIVIIIRRRRRRRKMLLPDKHTTRPSQRRMRKKDTCWVRFCKKMKNKQNQNNYQLFQKKKKKKKKKKAFRDFKIMEKKWENLFSLLFFLFF